MDDRILRFKVFFQGWSPANESFPITSVTGFLLGAFVVSEGPVWNCFMSRSGYPESLSLSRQDGVYLTPDRSPDHGGIVKIMVSNVKITDESKKVTIDDSYEDLSG